MQYFKLSEVFLRDYVGKQPNWGYGALSYFTYKRTYARNIEGEDRTEEFWETLKRVVEGVFTIQKQHCVHYRLHWDNRRAQRTAQNMFRKMWEFKFLPPGRGLWAMGTKMIEEKGSAALNNPLHEDTRILTKEYGWIELSEIEGQEVTVLSNTKLYGRDNSTTANVIWTKATISHAEEHPCSLIEYEDRNKNKYTVIASQNHRWFRRRHKTNWSRVTTEDLQVGDYMPRTKPPKYFKMSLQGAQHGFFFGDGTRSNGELHQFGDDNLAVLERLFTNIQDAKDLESGLIHKVVRQCPYAWGYLPDNKYAEDQRYLYGFLAGYFAADGSFVGNKCKISSARLDELNKVKDLFEQLGIGVSTPSLVSTSSNFKEERELYEIQITYQDLHEDFFLKEKHKEHFQNRYNKSKINWLKITKIERLADLHRVLCATVPEYEQFVIEGFCLTSNCGFVSTKNISVEGLASPFCWAMDMLMLGCGIGFDTKGAGFVVKQAQQSDAIYVIPDTREGWVESVQILFDAFNNGRPLPSYDYTKIRKAGEPIKGFGGVASGPEPLKKLHESLIVLLQSKVDEELSSVDIVDIFNFIGRCVVAGNVRRSAEIGIGQIGDYQFITCKDPSIEGNKEAMLGWRWASNNSLYVGEEDNLAFPASITMKNGEPGYIFDAIIRKYGRLCDAPDYLDSDYDGMNPCVEQVLESYELCNVVEDFPANHETPEEFWDTIKYAYMYAKTVALIPTHDPRTNAVMLRNRRIGLSQSGIEQAKKKFGSSRYYREFCDKAYEVVKKWDKTYSRWLCVPESKRKTSVKPSGTVSLLAGAFPGVHYAHSEFYLRSVRLAKNSPLIPALKRANYRIEESLTDEHTLVVYFPIKEQNFRKSKADVTMWEQLNNAAMMQRYWADNSVSVTISFSDIEAPDIPEALEMYRDKLKAVSFLPFKDHGYKQAPYTTVTEEDYNAYVQSLGELTFETAITDEDRAADKFCQGEACEIDISQKM